MLIKNLLGGVFFLAMTGGAAYAAEDQATGHCFNTDMALVPAGEFSMGSNKEENTAMWRDANALNPYGFNEQLYINERPSHKVTLPSFLIDKYEVTNAQYREFAIATQHGVPKLWQRHGSK